VDEIAATGIFSFIVSLAFVSIFASFSVFLTFGALTTFSFDGFLGVI
jgi:hypothetical protein